MAVQVFPSFEDQIVFCRFQCRLHRLFIHAGGLQTRIFHVNRETVQSIRSLNPQFKSPVFGSTTILKGHRSPWAICCPVS